MRTTVIIPTLCEAVRQQSLLSAINSAFRASKAPIKILIVVNGNRFGENLLIQLQHRSDVEVIKIEEASLTAAHIVGRKNVNTEFFSFLDDDDEYLEGALDQRIEILDSDQSRDLVVTNGFNRKLATDKLTYSRLGNVGTNPLFELFEENWLSSCNSLFRTSTIDISYFEDPHSQMEWTWLAFRLIMSGKIVCALDGPTFRCNDTPGSLSKSSKFIYSRVGLYSRMLEMSPPKPIVDIIFRRMSNAWHEISVFELDGGSRKRAIYAHIRSLTAHRQGWQFLLYTRRLLLGS